MNILGGILLTLSSCNLSFSTDPLSLEVETISVCQKKPKGLRVAIDSSVLIVLEQEGIELGGGSGNYFIYKKKRFILTAAHVVDSDSQLFVKDGEVKHLALPVYVDTEHDIAILVLDKDMTSVRPTKWKVRRKSISVGDTVYHSGNPSGIEGLTAKGFVSKVYSDSIIMQSLAWMGSSGSVVFDERGRAVGVLSAIKSGFNGHFFQPLESMVFVSRTNDLSEKLKELLGT